jgi:catechol 2,3-dioxygenase-like lactoylglutathione lyase family enzyme
MDVERLDHLVLTVANIAKACLFYESVLGMEVRNFGGGRLALHFGNQKINLHQAGAEVKPNARNAMCGSADLCFVTTTPMADVVAHLSACGVAIEHGPVAQTGTLGAITSVYFRDPDGNLIEIAEYGVPSPMGRGLG